MGPLDLVRHPLIFTGITLPEFIRWYFGRQPLRILQSYVAYLRAFVEIFSFLFLLRTLFSPWRQITDGYPSQGFNIGKIAQAFTLNVVSRTIGFLFRTTTLFFGLVSVLLLTVCFGIFFMAWMAFPLMFWVGFTYVLSVFL